MQKCRREILERFKTFDRVCVEIDRVWAARTKLHDRRFQVLPGCEERDYRLHKYQKHLMGAARYLEKEAKRA